MYLGCGVITMSNRNNLTLTQIRQILPIEQQRAAELLNDNVFADKGDRKTQEEIANELGVSDRTIRNWKREPAFMAYSEYLANQVRNEFYPVAVAQLMKAIEGGANGQGSIRAIELFLKLSGKLVDQTHTITESVDRLPRSREDITADLEELNDIIR